MEYLVTHSLSKTIIMQLISDYFFKKIFFKKHRKNIHNI